MLSMVFLLPVGFMGLIWMSYRKDRRARAEGQGFDPAGSTRWGGKT